MVREGLLAPLDLECLPIYEFCLVGKTTKKPFKAKGHRTTDLLGLVHTDVCGSMSIRALGGYKYFITYRITQGLFIFTWWDESLNLLKSSNKAKVEKQTGKQSKYLDHIEVDWWRVPLGRF